jgi:hypothetical protein
MADTPIMLSPNRRNVPAGRSLFVALVAGLWFTIGSGLLHGGEKDEVKSETLEYQVKAGFLFNFAKFVEWPERGEAKQGAFRIGIVDGGEAFAILAEVLAGKSVRGRRVETVRLKPEDDLKQCDLLFITRFHAKSQERMLKAVGDAPVLTVGEGGQFIRQGGRINFVLKDQSVRFEVNLEAAKRAGLKISSTLASMATVVRKPGGKP